MNTVLKYLVLALIALKYMTAGAPLTKWFKTDNATYYIETEEKFSWQQSYKECQAKQLQLLSHKSYNEDKILLQYLKQSFDPVPEFWLKSDEMIDLNTYSPTLTEQLMQLSMNMKFDMPDELKEDNPNNCVLALGGATNKACQNLHGFVCVSQSQDENCAGKNVQNIIFKLS